MKESRLAMVAFATFGVIAFAWMIPWAPSGLSPDEYSPEVIFTIFLLAGFAATGIIAFALRDLARRDQARVAALGEFYDEATGMNNRFYLLDRLAARSARAGRQEKGFSLLILRIDSTSAETNAPIRLSSAMLRTTGEVIKKLVRQGDLVATLGESEFAVVADDFSEKQRADLAARLHESLLRYISQEGGSTTSVSISSGIATFPDDGAEPEALITAARECALAETPAAA